MAYEGWTNYNTWNVSLWINNDYNLYLSAIAFMREVNPTQDIYKGFIVALNATDKCTPDDVAFMDDSLNYDELDEMMKEMVA